MKKKIKFPFQLRMAMTVVYAIAEEILSNAQRGKPFGSEGNMNLRPVLLSIRRTKGQYAFHFESGVVVSPHLVDLNSFSGYSTGQERKHQEWVIVSADVKYYRHDIDAPEKLSLSWDSELLRQLKKLRPWYHPHVQDINTITGVIAIFWNNAASDGYTEVDPSSLQEGNYHVRDEVKYARLIPGDLERARTEAEARLAKYYR